MIPINSCFHVHACYFHPICIMTWSTCRCLPLDPQRKVRGIKVRRALAAQWWRRGGTVWLRRPRLVLRDHTRKTTTCFTKFPPTQVASTLGLARCVVLWMILCHEQRTNYVKMWIFVIVESRVLKLVKGHSCIPARSVIIFGTYLLEPYQQSVVCVWHERTKKECMQLLTYLSHMYLYIKH